MPAPDGKDEPKETMWRVGPQVKDRVDAFIPVLERKLGIRMSRAQAIEYLLNKGLDAEGAPSLTAIDAA